MIAKGGNRAMDELLNKRVVFFVSEPQPHSPKMAKVAYQATVAKINGTMISMVNIIDADNRPYRNKWYNTASPLFHWITDDV